MLGGGGTGRERDFTSHLNKILPKEKEASGRCGFLFFIIIIFLGFWNCFLGLESVSRIFIVLYGALVTRLSSRSTADFKPPSIWKESVLSRRISFLPKSAAVAETPQVPELRLRWHRPRGLGEGARRPGWAWHPLPSSFLRPLPTATSPPTPAPPPSTSRILQRATGNPRAPVRAPQPTMGSASHKLQPRQEDYHPAGKGPEVGRAGMGRWPPPAGAEGQRGRNRETGRSASCPAHSSFSYRFYRSASEAGETGHKPLITNWFREGKAGEDISTPQL